MANSVEPRPDSGTAPTKTATIQEHHGFPWVFTLITLLVIGGIVALVIYRRHTSAKGKGAGHGRGAGMPVAAVIGVVTQKNFSIYLDGLGTVQAFNSVNVQTRVDGQVQKIAFQEGQDVHAGDLLAQIDPAPYQTQVEQAEGKKGQDEASLSNAVTDLKRNESLLANKIIAQSVYDTAKALVQQLEAAVKADDAAIENAKVQLNYTRITAPIDGRTGIRMVDAGNIVRAAQSNSIVLLTQLRPISLIFTLPEQSLNEIQDQQNKAPMTVLAVARDNKTLLDTGKLSVVDNQIDTATGTIRLKATFPNPNLKLWPGEFVNARLLLSVRTNAVVVPASVVQRGPDGEYAFVVGEDSRVKMAPLKVGKIDQGEALIDSGLTPGERVVVDGQYKLEEGSLVKSAEAQPTNTVGLALGAGTNRPGASKPGAAVGARKKKAK